MRNKLKLQYHLVDTETNESIYMDDNITVYTMNPKGFVTGIVKSFPSGCLKLCVNGSDTLISLGNISKIEKKAKKIYVLMEQDSCESMFSQYDVMGTTYDKSKALDWVNQNPEFRRYRETKAPK